MKRPSSWVCTLLTQLLLCAALYFALNLGQSRKKLGSNHQVGRSGRIRGSGDGALDFHFVTVRGGSRLPYQPALLLKMMEKVQKDFDTKFVINISDLGEDDPLVQNGTRKFMKLEIPWYNTRASHGATGNFHEQIKLPLGRTLDIIGVDTGFLRDPNVTGSSDVVEDEQYRWLRRTQEAMDGDWCIVAGFHPLNSWTMKTKQAEEDRDPKSVEEFLAKFGANMYLSGMGCTSSNYKGGIAYIENPGLMSYRHGSGSSFGTSSILSRDVVLLLHRVTQLKIVTYFIDVHNEVIHQTVLRQKGKDVM
ncbi:hypothetical protein SAY87_008704 [Trapa incisa]|uniref:Calcineurin-like phosphoesterase domain-containing protein n=1 Tax=Trapa incisa TaxID=236973 RepID=A0AAN7JXK7_9MYRT|nr:hypothetical protein SAY87_008704 [Trapa incisa]